MERRREERKREQSHQEWVSNQKRELMTLRMQRALVKADKHGNINPSVAAALEESRTYNAEIGVLISWDFATGLPKTTESAKVRVLEVRG